MLIEGFSRTGQYEAFFSMEQLGTEFGFKKRNEATYGALANMKLGCSPGDSTNFGDFAISLDRIERREPLHSPSSNLFSFKASRHFFVFDFLTLPSTMTVFDTHPHAAFSVFEKLQGKLARLPVCRPRESMSQLASDFVGLLLDLALIALGAMLAWMRNKRT
nr:hypothetical protein [Rhodoferax sp. PAMC 29310]